MKSIDDVLMAEAIKLWVHNVFNRKGHDGVLVENDIGAFIDFICPDKSVARSVLWPSGEGPS